MKPKHTHLSCLFILTVVLFFACASPGGKELITKHKWIKHTVVSEKAIDLNDRGTASTDLIAQSPACITDDIFSFNENGVFIQDDNEYVCNDNQEKGSWSFVGKDSVLVNFNKETSVKFKIEKVTSSNLVLVANMNFVPEGVKVTYTFNVAD